MTISDRTIRSNIKAFWRSNPGIQNHTAFTLSTGASTGDSTFGWTPTSVDPGSVSYGLAVGDVTQEAESNNWLVPIFFGLQSGTSLKPFVSTALVFNPSGLLQNTSTAVLVKQDSSDSPITLPSGVFFASTSVNTALFLIFVGIQVANLIDALNAADTTTGLASTGTLSGLLVNQAISAVRAVFADEGDADKLTTLATSINTAWGLYDAKIQNWATAGGWTSKSGNAWETSDGLRFWRTSVVVDQDVWAIHEKIDIIRDGTQDDHVLITASGTRSTTGALSLTAMGTDVRIAALGSNPTFSIEPDLGATPPPVFSTWADKLRAATAALSEADRKQIDTIIANMGSNAGNDLLTWLAGAEVPASGADKKR